MKQGERLSNSERVFAKPKKGKYQIGRVTKHLLILVPIINYVQKGRDKFSKGIKNNISK